MGILKRIKGRVVAGLGAVREEGRHPGGPVDRGDFRDPELSRDALESPQETPVPATTESGAKKSPGGQDYWFLDEDAEGWDQTNPSSDDEKD